MALFLHIGSIAASLAFIECFDLQLHDMFLLNSNLLISDHVGQIVANLVLITFLGPRVETLFIDLKDFEGLLLNLTD